MLVLGANGRHCRRNPEEPAIPETEAPSQVVESESRAWVRMCNNACGVYVCVPVMRKDQTCDLEVGFGALLFCQISASWKVEEEEEGS